MAESNLTPENLNLQSLYSDIQKIEKDINSLKGELTLSEKSITQKINGISNSLSKISSQIDKQKIDENEKDLTSIEDYSADIETKDLSFIETCLGLSALATGVSVFVIEIDNVQISRLKIVLVVFISVINLAVMWGALWSLALTFNIKATMPERYFTNIKSDNLEWLFETLREIKLSRKQVFRLLLANLGPYTILVYALLFWLFLSIGLTIWMPFN